MSLGTTSWWNKCSTWDNQIFRNCFPELSSRTETSRGRLPHNFRVTPAFIACLHRLLLLSPPVTSFCSENFWDPVSELLQLLAGCQLNVCPFKPAWWKFWKPQAGVRLSISPSESLVIKSKGLEPGRVASCSWHHSRHRATSPETCQEHRWKSRTKDSVKKPFRE